MFQVLNHVTFFSLQLLLVLLLQFGQIQHLADEAVDLTECALDAVVLIGQQTVFVFLAGQAQGDLQTCQWRAYFV